MSPCSIGADIIGVKILIATDVESPAANNGVGEIGIGGLLLHLALTRNPEAVFRDIEQVHRVVVIEGVKFSV